MNHTPSKPAKSASRRKLLTLLAAFAALAAGGALAVAALGKPAVATPTITSGPSSPTNQTSATFAFKAGAGGVAVTFQCSLDGAAFAACTSPKTYAGLAPGSHTFQVRARNSAGQLSDPASRTWVIDVTAPSLTLAFPTAGGTFNAAGWATGCPGGAGVCGGASDPSGVAAVRVSIQQQASGKWWNGKNGYSATSETFATATGTTSWRYALPLPAPDGTYLVHIRATDGAGNATAPSAQLSATFKVDTKAPPAPAITQKPASSTSATSATFAFSDSEAGVGFECQLDTAAWAACTSPKSYSSLAVGQHTFRVRALDAAGNRSSATTYTWTITQDSGQPFTVSGTAAGSFYPGVSRTLNLRVTNPNSVTIYVTSLTVTIQSGSSKAGCDGPTNLTVTQSNASSTTPLTVPANGYVDLPAGGVTAPTLAMKDLATNQDACKGALFSLSYGGSAHS